MENITFLDIITLIVLAWAVITGWCKGLISQIASLLGFILSIWLASHYGAQVGALLHLSPSWQNPGGFFIVVILTLIAVALAGWMIDKFLKIIGLGILNRLLGVAVAILKWGLLLSALLTAFLSLNKRIGLVEESSLRKSVMYDAYTLFSEKAMPQLKQMLDEIPWEKVSPEKPENHE
jgi:membrane protein required for colicin V production